MLLKLALYPKRYTFVRYKQGFLCCKKPNTVEKTYINLLIVRLFRKQLSLFLIICTSYLSAQQEVLTDFPDNHFSHFTTADGLAGNIIYAVVIDKDGFVWIGTNNGLARYDGQRFTPFNALVSHSDLPTTTIRALFVDSHAALWVRFENQTTFRIDLHTYEVEQLKDDFWQHDESFPPTAIEDKAGNVWLSVSTGIVKCTYSDKKLTLYPFNSSEEKKVLSICKGDDSYFWALTRKGLYRFDLQTHTFIREKEMIPFDEKTRTIGTDEVGNLWFSNWYDDKVGIACYDPKKRQIIRQFNKQQISPNTNTDVWHIETLGDKVWFTTNSGGVLVYDTKQNLFKTYTYNPKDPLSIQSNQVLTSQKDKDGNMWVGTVNGLHLLRAHRKEVLLLPHNPFDKNSLVSAIATSAYNLDDRRIVLATQAGLSIYDRINKSFKNIDLPLYNGNQYNNTINAVTSGDKGNFWVGTCVVGVVSIG